MARPTQLKRKSFFVDEKTLGQARKALGVNTDAEAVRLSIEWVAEMEAFWKSDVDLIPVARPATVPVAAAPRAK